MSEETMIRSSEDSDDQELAALFLAQTPLIDVRAPVEFAQGSIPGAVNLPLLNDEERAAVGTTYKQEGQQAAIDLGLKLISGDVREQRMKAWIDFARENPRARIYCFRGGLRSQSVQQALKETGYDLPLMPGGYKRMRRFLLETIERACHTESFAVISGFTGVGKTVFLQSLSLGSFRTLDLEGLARHRGSAFGKWPISQPTQIDFENFLAVEFLKLQALASSKNKTLLLEDESRGIGRCLLPSSLFHVIGTAPVYVIERSIEERARFLVELYLRENYGLLEGERDLIRLQRLYSDLRRDLDGIRRRVGGADHKSLIEMIDLAMYEHAETGSLMAHQKWVERLLVRYYDPMYSKHLETIKERVAFRGTAAEVEEALKQRLD